MVIVSQSKFHARSGSLYDSYRRNRYGCGKVREGNGIVIWFIPLSYETLPGFTRHFHTACDFLRSPQHSYNVLLKSCYIYLEICSKELKTLYRK